MENSDKNFENQALQFVNRSVSLILESISDRDNSHVPLRENEKFEQIKQQISLSKGGGLPQHDDVLLDAFGTVLKYSMRTAHPRFVSQLYGETDLYGVAADFLTTVLNNNVHVFELAPALTTVEALAIEHLSEMFGLVSSENNSQAVGIFVPGSSYGTLVALFLALSQKYEDFCVKGSGAYDLKPRVMCSEDAHYSIEKACLLLGLGLNGVCKIPTDKTGRMCIGALAEALDDPTHSPFCVVATAGTTTTGVFDGLEPIANLCRDKSIWLHTDAAWGGAACYSESKNRHLAGVERSDSIVFSAHKMLGAPIQCSALLLKPKHRDHLTRSVNVKAPYLYQTAENPHADSHDISKMTFQCGRRGDALKFWFMMQARGVDGFRERVDGCVSWAQELETEITTNRSHSFEVLHQTFSTVCFWHRPPFMSASSVRDVPIHSDEWWAIDKLPALVREAMVSDAYPFLITHCRSGNHPSFYRISFASSIRAQDERTRLINELLDYIEGKTSEQPVDHGLLHAGLT